MKWIVLLSCLTLVIIGCTMTQLRVVRTVATRAQELMDHPIVDMSPLAPVAGLLAALFGVVRNVTEQRIRARGGEVKMSGVKNDTRNILSKISSSRKYMVATIVSAVLVAVAKFYDIGIDGATIAKIVASLFGIAILGNAIEDAAEKRA